MMRAHAELSTVQSVFRKVQSNVEIEMLHMDSAENVSPEIRDVGSPGVPQWIALWS